MSVSFRWTDNLNKESHSNSSLQDKKVGEWWEKGSLGMLLWLGQGCRQEQGSLIISFVT